MVASGRYHRSVRSVDLARLQDSFRFPFLSRLGDYLTVPPNFFLDPVATLPSALARAAASTARRRSQARRRAPASPRRPTAPEPPRALPHQLGPHLPCPRSPGLLASRAPPGLAAPPCLPERPCLRSSRVIKFHRALVLPPSSLVRPNVSISICCDLDQVAVIDSPLLSGCLT